MSVGIVSCEQESESVIVENGKANQRTGSPISQIYDLAEKLGDQVKEDPSLDPKNSMTFESIEDYEAFIIKQKSLTEGIIIPKLEIPAEGGQGTTLGCADGIYTGSFNFGAGTLLFDLVVKGGKITEVSSRLVGWTLGTSYTQGAVFITVKGNEAIVKGTISYDIFFEGVGRVYSQASSHTIKLGC